MSVKYIKFSSKYESKCNAGKGLAWLLTAVYQIEDLETAWKTMAEDSDWALLYSMEDSWMWNMDAKREVHSAIENLKARAAVNNFYMKCSNHDDFKKFVEQRNQ